MLSTKDEGRVSIVDGRLQSLQQKTKTCLDTGDGRAKNDFVHDLPKKPFRFDVKNKTAKKALHNNTQQQLKK